MLTGIEVAFARRYQAVLTERLGLVAEVDDDGSILATVCGARLVVENTAPDDPEYMSIGVAIPLPAGCGSAPIDLLATRCTASRKSVKVYRADDRVIVTVEMFVAGTCLLPTSEHLAAVLPRALGSLLAAIEEVVETIQLESSLQYGIDDNGSEFQQ
jgi:hypothetical protein